MTFAQNTRARPPSRLNTKAGVLASPAYVLRLLRHHFGPTVQVKRLESYGVKGARVVTREKGQTFVHAQCFTGTDEAYNRAAAAALKGIGVKP